MKTTVITKTLLGLGLILFLLLTACNDEVVEYPTTSVNEDELNLERVVNEVYPDGARQLTNGSAPYDNPSLAWAGSDNGGEFGVVWQTLNAGIYDLYFNRILSDGTSYNQVLVNSSSTQSQLNPSLIWSEDADAYRLVFEENQTGSTTVSNIRMMQISRTGNTQSGLVTIPFTGFNNARWFSNPYMVAGPAGSNVYAVVCQGSLDKTSTYSDIYLAIVRSDGSIIEQEAIATGSPNTRNSQPSIAYQPGTRYGITWLEKTGSANALIKFRPVYIMVNNYFSLGSTITINPPQGSELAASRSISNIVWHGQLNKYAIALVSRSQGILNTLYSSLQSFLISPGGTVSNENEIGYFSEPAPSPAQAGPALSTVSLAPSYFSSTYLFAAWKVWGEIKLISLNSSGNDYSTTRITTDPALSYHPSLAGRLDASNNYAWGLSWVDERDGSADIYFKN